MEGAKDVGMKAAPGYYNVNHVDISMEEASCDRARVHYSPPMSR